MALALIEANTNTKKQDRNASPLRRKVIGWGRANYSVPGRFPLYHMIKQGSKVRVRRLESLPSILHGKVGEVKLVYANGFAFSVLLEGRRAPEPFGIHELEEMIIFDPADIPPATSTETKYISCKRCGDTLTTNSNYVCCDCNKIQYVTCTNCAHKNPRKFDWCDYCGIRLPHRT